LKNGDILLTIKACVICGSDLHTYRHGLFLDLGIPMGKGIVMGHEFSGEIERIEGEQPDYKIGDRVIAFTLSGANVEKLRVPN
jgi:threonine dehydrogenase-like Zn-dependent dehydrogenase